MVMKHAGSDVDFDQELEAASVEFLVNEEQ